ncbi:glutathione S-transferase [Periconia macrospinosa]|uniref:Glutathione S-transferase n=1 Tax=Periconia macrospinosa TaxID=97972 RepID=A0A2V1D755_9PLEO|nr:glutathione S-transferase [Periconia macrospinosa]
MASAPEGKAPKLGLNVYGSAVVNPYKISILAEELGLTYNYINLDVAAGDHQSDWFVKINPNGKVPAIVHVKEDGTSVTVFESAACLLYLTHEFDKEHKFSRPVGTPEYWTQLSWLSWQVAGYGPMMGQAAHFNRYAYEPVPYGAWRYTAESRRLHSVLDKQLSTSPYVGGDQITIADFAVFIYTHSARWCGIDINEWPNVKAWHDKLLQRPGVQRGLQTPVPYPFSDAAVSSENQEFYKTLRQWGAQGIKAASEKWKGEAAPVPSDHRNYE